MHPCLNLLDVDGWSVGSARPRAYFLRAPAFPNWGLNLNLNCRGVHGGCYRFAQLFRGLISPSERIFIYALEIRRSVFSYCSASLFAGDVIWLSMCPMCASPFTFSDLQTACYRWRESFEGSCVVTGRKGKLHFRPSGDRSDITCESF